MQQVLLRIPIETSWFPNGIPIYGFGLMLFLAFLICTWLAGRRAEREGVPKEYIHDLAIWLFLGGLVGARLTYFLSDPLERGAFFNNPLRFFMIWEGGIVLYGAIVGGFVSYLIARWVSFYKYQVPTLKLADIIAPSITVGICLGRLGCFLNGCCFGQVACPDCVVYPVHFPLASHSGQMLHTGGYQTVGFFVGDQPGGGGVVVNKVVPGSAAARVGLAPGDVIVQAGGKDINTAAELDGYVAGLWSSRERGKTDLDLVVRSTNGGTANAPFLANLSANLVVAPLQRLPWNTVAMTLLAEPRAEPKPVVFQPRTLGLYPTQLTESISMFLLFLLLVAYFPFRRHNGEVTAILMVGYAIHRALNELLRDDPRPKSFEMYFSIGLIVLGVWLFLWVWRQPAQYQTQMAKATT